MQRFAALLAFGLLPSTAVAQEAFNSRFGELSIGEDKILRFNGEETNPLVEGNNFLSFDGTYGFSDYDLVLVLDTGGTGCPAFYHIVKLSTRGATVSEAFGTCAELSVVTRTGTGIMVELPGFMGPGESNWTKAKASKELYRYTYENGIVTKNKLR